MVNMDSEDREQPAFCVYSLVFLCTLKTCSDGVVAAQESDLPTSSSSRPPPD